MRNLASVVTIESVEKMFEKDRIVAAHMKENAYEVIVPNTFKPGDKMIFIQEGSILPEKETWEFLRKRCYKESLKGFLIAPMVLGAKEALDENGQPTKGERVRSWGLAVGVNECGLTEGEIRRLKAGDDVTEALEIRKYEPVEDASPTSSKKAYPKWVKFCLGHTLTRWIGRIWQKRHQNSAGGFPTSIITQSDETTVQNMKGVLEKFADEKVYISAKIEGQSATIVPTFKGKRLTGAYICSRKNAYKLKDNSIFWTCMSNYGIIDKMKDIYKKTGKAYVLQGEQVGPNIQDNIYDFKTNRWFIYTVKDYETLNQLPIDEAKRVTTELFGLDFVPILANGVVLKDVMPDIDTAVAYAERAAWKPLADGKFDFNVKIGENDKIWKDYIQHEGVVVRTVNYDKDKNIGTSFKVKNAQYAEKGLGNIHKACIELKNK